MKRFTFLLVISLFLSVGLMSQDKNEINPKSLLTRAISTNVSPTYPNALYDLLGNYSVDSLVGTVYSYGVCWTGTEYITSRFSVNMFNRISSSWTKIDSFAASGASTGFFRDLAYAKGLVWGSPLEGTIYGINPTTGVMVKSITCSGAAQIRAITWDPVRNGFWCGTNSFTGPLICYDTTGAVISGATITMPASGCYGIAYDDDPAGPFLWLSTDQSPASPTGISIVKYNATTLAQIGTPINITIPFTVPGTGSTALASGASEVVKTLVPGKRTLVGMVQGDPDRVYVVDLGNTDAGPLLPFNLQTPVAGTTITSIPGSNTPVTITWDTSRAGATYKWIFGTSLPSRILTIPSSTNMLTKTLGEIDVILAGLGLNQGDSVSGSWDVWAFRNNDPQNDSLKAANGPRTIKFKRTKPALTAFNLVSPATGSTIQTTSGSTAPLIMNWSRSGAGVTYKWYYASPNFGTNANIKFSLPASNSGLDSTLTTTSGVMDALVAGIGVALGDSTVGQWRVYAYSGTDSLASATTFNITFKRASVVTIGNGTTAVSYPFYTFYEDSRTDMLYLGSEIGTVSNITTIGFDVAVAYPLVMNGFNLKMQNSTLTTLSGFADSTAWTVVYSGTYSVPGTGWQNIALATPFALQAGKNLIIEICFNNATYTSSSTVRATATSQPQVWHRHQDLPSGDGCVVPLTYTSTNSERPNIRLFMSGVVGIGNTGNTLPSVYSLSQNYPNPFNPTTKINFAIPKQGFVNLKIYDVLGREVRTLVSEVKTPGNYIVDFNAEELSSGVYFYKLSSGNFTDVKRMMLIK